MNRRVLRVGGLVFMSAALGCGSDSTAPKSALPGLYAPSQWVTTGASGQTNQLLAGSTLSLTLDFDGKTSGHLHVAAAGSNPAFDADMTGTWSESGNKVTFSQPADTFVRDLTFNVVPNGDTWSLSTDQVVNGTRIQLTLDRTIVAVATANLTRGAKPIS